MGLFGGSKTYVASTLYNLAGPEEDRSNYLKTLVIGNVISNSQFSMGETIRSGYVRGPGIKMRNFFRWAETEYEAIGVPKGNLGGAMVLDLAVVQDELPHDPGDEVMLQTADVGIADYSYWAEQWMFENEPSLLETDWTADINETTGDITITFEDTTTETFTPVDFDKTGVYLYATYVTAVDGGDEAPVIGSPVPITPPTDPFPDTTGFTLISDDSVPDGDNTIETIVYEKTVYMGQDDEIDTDRTYSLKTTMTFIDTRDIDDISIDRTYQIDTQKLFHNAWSKAQIYIYKIDSGNATLDELVVNETDGGEFFPFIPVRLNNQFLSESYLPDAYTAVKKAFRRAGGGNIDDIIDKVADNEDLDEIDYAYIMYGVSLNTIENTAKEYLFRFFDKLRLSQTSSNVEFLLWEEQNALYQEQMTEWTLWKAAQTDSENPLFGTIMPFVITKPSRPGSYVQITAVGEVALSNVNMKISWKLIEKLTGDGLGKVGAKKGDYWLTKDADLSDTDIVYSDGSLIDGLSGGRTDNSVFSIYWQNEDDEWTRVQVKGATHENLIYNGKSVLITSSEALDDSEESGFLVPIHYATYREMRLVDSTQMATSCTFIVFNSYKVVKQKWYQTGIFKIFVFIVIIALTIAFPPLGGAAAATYTSIGVAIGLSGLLATIVGAVIYSLISMIVLRIIGKLSVAIFGEKFGMIIAAVASMVAMQVGTGLLNGQSMSSIWSGMLSASNLLGLTSSLINGVSGYVQASAQQTMQQTADLTADYDKESKRISDLYAENLGYDNGVFDPMRLTDSAFNGAIQNVMEPEALFLYRTLLTGSDIAAMSTDMLNNFANYTISTNLPGAA